MRIGDKITGTITGIKPYGAFVALDNGTTGLIHISEIKTGYIENIYQKIRPPTLADLLGCTLHVIIQVWHVRSNNGPNRRPQYIDPLAEKPGEKN